MNQTAVEKLLDDVAEVLTPSAGKPFFRHLVFHLARLLEVDFVFVGVLDKNDPKRVHTVAGIADGAPVDNFTYSLTGAPCETVIGKLQFQSYLEQVHELFPSDTWLKENGIESYLGIPLCDTDERPLGLIALLHRRRLGDCRRAESVLKLCAARAGAELERLEADTERRRVEESLRDMAHVLSSATGEDFFRALVLGLSQTLDGDYVFVGEFDPQAQIVRTVAVSHKGCLHDNFEYHAVPATGHDHSEHPATCYFTGGAEKLCPNEEIIQRFKVQTLIGYPLSNPGGEVCGILGVLQTGPIKNHGRLRSMLQISAARAGAELERLHAEQALRISEEDLRALAENANDGILVNHDNRHVFANRRLADLLGYTLEELRRTGIRELVHPDEYDKVTARFRARLEGKPAPSQYETVFMTKNGKSIPVEINATRTLWQGKPAGLVFIRNITARKQAEDKITRLGRILDDSSNEIYVFNAESLRFIQVNRGAQRNLGYTMHELKNLTPLDLKPEFTRQTFEALIAPLRSREKERLNFTTVHRRKDGSDYPVEVQLQLMRQESPPVFVAIIQNITERKLVEKQLSYLAYYDTLTGLPNRARLLERLQQAMLDAGRVNRLVAVMFLDLDRFKYVNDTLGHHVGDGLLKGVAERLKTSVRPGDIISRLGGDEFTVVLASVAHADDVARVARKILESFIEPFRIEGRYLYTTPSIGIAIYPSDESNAEGLLKNADAAMYHAKEQGRNSFKFFTAELNTRAERRLHIENALRVAIELHELTLHYQPQVDTKTGRIIGMEALLRWQHPVLGSVSPVEFIPIAEETGLILPIGEWVLREACRQVKTWHATKFSFSKMQVAVNVSGKQLRQKSFPDLVRQVLEDTGLEARYLDLELTESLLMEDVEQTADAMHMLHDLGVSFSVDDFGTGYSSLAYLKRFPIDILKIDRTFVRDIANDANDVAIVKTIIAMAHTLGMRVVAEGVETHQQLQFLRSQGCDGSQGYYCSMPLPAEEFSDLLVEWERMRQGKCHAQSVLRQTQKKRPATVKARPKK